MGSRIWKGGNLFGRLQLRGKKRAPDGVEANHRGCDRRSPRSSVPPPATQSQAGPSFRSPEVASAPSKILTARKTGQALSSWMLLLYAPNVFVWCCMGGTPGLFCQRPHNVRECCVSRRPTHQTPPIDLLAPCQMAHRSHSLCAAV